MIWGMFFKLWGAHRGILRVPNGFQWTTLCAMRSEDKRFYFGIISLWENWVFLTQKVNKEISNDLMHVLAVFRLWGPPKGPWGPQMVPNGQPSMPWEVEMNFLLWEDFTTGKLDIDCLKGGQNNIWLEKRYYWENGTLKNVSICSIMGPTKLFFLLLMCG